VSIESHSAHQLVLNVVLVSGNGHSTHQGMSEGVLVSDERHFTHSGVREGSGAADKARRRAFAKRHISPPRACSRSAEHLFLQIPRIVEVKIIHHDVEDDIVNVLGFGCHIS